MAIKKKKNTGTGALPKQMQFCSKFRAVLRKQFIQYTTGKQKKDGKTHGEEISPETPIPKTFIKYNPGW